MSDLKFEDFIDARELHDEIINNFPENYKDVINNRLDKITADNDIQLRHAKKQYLRHLSTFFLNDYLNKEHLFSKEEMNYVLEVRTTLSDFFGAINEEF